MSFSWVVSGILVLFTTSINSNTLILIRFYNVKPITYNKNWVWISLHVHPSYLWHSQWGLQCKTLFTRRNNPCIHPIYKILFIIPQKHLHVTGNYTWGSELLARMTHIWEEEWTRATMVAQCVKHRLFTWGQSSDSRTHKKGQAGV